MATIEKTQAKNTLTRVIGLIIGLVVGLATFIITYLSTTDKEIGNRILTGIDAFFCGFSSR